MNAEVTFDADVQAISEGDVGALVHLLKQIRPKGIHIELAMACLQVAIVECRVAGGTEAQFVEHVRESFNLVKLLPLMPTRSDAS